MWALILFSLSTCDNLVHFYCRSLKSRNSLCKLALHDIAIFFSTRLWSNCISQDFFIIFIVFMKTCTKLIRSIQKFLVDWLQYFYSVYKTVRACCWMFSFLSIYFISFSSKAMSCVWGKSPRQILEIFYIKLAKISIANTSLYNSKLLKKMIKGIHIWSWPSLNCIRSDD